MGYLINIFIDRMRKHVPAGARVLDVACGPGYVALEVARAGFDVLGIDIAGDAIRSARETAESNPFKEGFGRLAYENTAFTVDQRNAFQGPFDVVLFSGALHHFKDLDAALNLASELLAPGGIVIASEPQHEVWTEQDAAQVALIRSLLTLTGVWYQDEAAHDEESLDGLVKAIHREYLLERDPGEPDGQSPNDLSHDGPEILEHLKQTFETLETAPTVSFTYRLLGGLRGPDEQIYKIADFLAAYDKYAVDKGYMNANAFIFVGRNRV
jgi:SAM-dependent methyltransferase